jgi:hypothetical protein
VKLRIRDDSVRLRLTQSEVEAIGEGKDVEARVRFGPTALTYVLRPGSDASSVGASYSDDRLVVTLPAALAREWAGSDELTVRADQPIDSGDGALRILVEKDLQCLVPREGEDDSDAYPNPGC